MTLSFNTVTVKQLWSVVVLYVSEVCKIQFPLLYFIREDFQKVCMWFPVIDSEAR